MDEKICSKCKQPKAVELFRKSKRMSDGLQSCCKQCADMRSEEWRQRNRTKRNKQIANRAKGLLKRFHQWKAEQGCQRCEEDDPVCLDLHHRNPAEKEFNPSMLVNSSWKRLMKEAEKCVVVCRNCHAKIHAHRKTHRGMIVHTTKVTNVKIKISV